MKRIISTLLIGSVSSLMAMYGEQSYLYKDNRIMGMGGANVAVGGYSTSVFYNPAGLTSIDKEEGFVVDLLGLQVGASEKFQDFADDMSEAMDDEDDTAIIRVLQKYNGEHFHANVSNYTSISKHSDLFAWSVGLLVGMDANYMTHSDGSPQGPSLETTSRGYGGVVIGASKDFSTKVGTVDVGISGKLIQEKSYEGLIPLNDLVTSDDIVTLLEDYEHDASGFGVDLGIIYHPFPKNYWNPSIGLSVLNIGGMSMDDTYGQQPMTVNLGVAISPEVPYIHKLVVAADYVDIFDANQVRVYTYNPNNTDHAYKYIDVDDTDMIKKLRAGVMAELVNNTYFALTLNGGLYQGAWTAGADITLTILKLSLATYEENLGYGSFDLTDRRYSLQLGIGW